MPGRRERAARGPRLAAWLSNAGHPFVTGLALVAGVEAPAGRRAVARAVALVVVLVLVPLSLLAARQVRRGAWGNPDASDPRERPVLFLVGAVGLATLLGGLLLTRPHSPLVPGTVGALVLVAVCAAITPRVKLSLHMVTGALAAAVLIPRAPAAGLVLAAGLPAVGWSRVALGRHRWVEVGLGLLVGAAAGAILGRVA